MPITYIFGLTSAEEYWVELVLPSQRRFLESGARGDAIIASMTAWSLHDWLYDEHGKGMNRSSFTADQYKACPELKLVRSVAEAGKHKRLDRKADVKSVDKLPTFAPGYVEIEGIVQRRGGNVGEHLYIVDDNGQHGFADALNAVIAYWKRAYFP